MLFKLIALWKTLIFLEPKLYKQTEKAIKEGLRSNKFEANTNYNFEVLNQEFLNSFNFSV